MPDFYHDTHYYISTVNTDWVADLGMWTGSLGTPATLFIRTRQTPGTVHCDRYNKRVVMHPSDRYKMMREADMAFLGNPLNWFEEVFR